MAPLLWLFPLDFLFLRRSKKLSRYLPSFPVTHTHTYSGVVKRGEGAGRPPPNCVQDHSKSLNPCRSWGAEPLECLRRSLLAPPKNNDPGYATAHILKRLKLDCQDIFVWLISSKFPVLTIILKTSLKK